MQVTRSNLIDDKSDCRANALGNLPFRLSCRQDEQRLMRPARAWINAPAAAVFTALLFFLLGFAAAKPTWIGAAHDDIPMRALAQLRLRVHSRQSLRSNLARTRLQNTSVTAFLNADKEAMSTVETRETGRNAAPMPRKYVAARLSTAAAPGPSHPPDIGHNLAEYLERAAVARSLLIGDVTYNFTAGAARRQKVIRDGITRGDTSPSPSLSPLTPLRIAQYSQVYMPAWYGNFTGCALPCEAAGENGNVSAAAAADVVVINMMSPSTPWTRPPGQIWLGTYFESPDHYPYLRNAATLAKFNYTTGYRPDADFPIFSMVRDTGASLNLTLPWPLPRHALKRRHAMMSTWISNCHLDSLDRLSLLTKLAGHNVTVASYGRCGPSQVKPRVGPDLGSQWHNWTAPGGRGAEKAAVSAQHLFMYAAENSGCAYYITEKVMHAFLGGSVPVYVGDATSLKKLAPPHSVVYAADFAGPAELAAYLHYLASNVSAYEAYLAWRTNPAALDAMYKFMSLPAWEATTPVTKACALCEFLWAAPRRVQPALSTDLCEPLQGVGTKFRLRL